MTVSWDNQRRWSYCHFNVDNLTSKVTHQHSPTFYIVHSSLWTGKNDPTSHWRSVNITFEVWQQENWMGSVDVMLSLEITNWILTGEAYYAADILITLPIIWAVPWGICCCKIIFCPEPIIWNKKKNMLLFWHDLKSTDIYHIVAMKKKMWFYGSPCCSRTKYKSTV